MAFSFLVNLTVAAVVPPSPDQYFTGGLAPISIFLLIWGTLSIPFSLPFGGGLGVSRRSYPLGPPCWCGGSAPSTPLGPTVLQAIERATAGELLGAHFFRVDHGHGLMCGTRLTSFVLLVLFFGYGMWYGQEPALDPPRAAPPHRRHRCSPALGAWSRGRYVSTGYASGNSPPPDGPHRDRRAGRDRPDRRALADSIKPPGHHLSDSPRWAADSR